MRRWGVGWRARGGGRGPALDHRLHLKRRVVLNACMAQQKRREGRHHHPNEERSERDADKSKDAVQVRGRVGESYAAHRLEYAHKHDRDGIVEH